MNTRVWIVDDHQSICTLLAGFIEKLEGFTVVACTSELAATRAQLKKGGIDVLVLDLHLESGKGTDLLNALPRNQARPRIVMHSGDTSLHAIECATKLGAECYVAKGDPIECFAEALRCARDGRRYYSPTIVTLLARCRVANLTPEDMELATLLLSHDHRGDLATKLHVSRPTLTRRLERLFQKLRITSPRGFVKSAAEHGLISLEAAPSGQATPSPGNNSPRTI